MTYGISLNLEGKFLSTRGFLWTIHFLFIIEKTRLFNNEVYSKRGLNQTF